jgi:hypothetical protein
MDLFAKLIADLDRLQSHLDQLMMLTIALAALGLIALWGPAIYQRLK